MVVCMWTVMILGLRCRILYQKVGIKNWGSNKILELRYFIFYGKCNRELPTYGQKRAERWVNDPEVDPQLGFPTTQDYKLALNYNCYIQQSCGDYCVKEVQTPV